MRKDGRNSSSILNTDVVTSILANLKSLQQHTTLSHTGDCFTEDVATMRNNHTVYGNNTNSKTVRPMKTILLPLQRKIKNHVMLDVSVHGHSRQTARAKHNVQAQFFVSMNNTHSTDRPPKQVFQQLMSSINIQTFSINIQQCENFFFCIQRSSPLVFSIQFKAAFHEILVLSR